MPSLSQKLRQVERAAQRLTRDRRQAVGFRKKLESRLNQVAAKQAQRPQQAALSEQQLIKTLITSGRANWVNDPGLGKAALVERGRGCVVVGLTGKAITAGKRNPKALPAVNKSAFIRHLKTPGIELFVPWMYLDCNRNVTVGVGHLLTDRGKARALPFVERQSGKPARKDQVVAAFDRVQMSSVRPGDWVAFRALTSVELTEPSATILAETDMDVFLNIIRSPSYFPEFDSYPELAKRALLDLVYNAGPRRTRDEYKRTTAAVRSRNWKKAGVEQRDGRSTFRANIAQRWFDQAARQEPFFISHAGCKKTLANLVGR